jgi:hypothetical protein
MERRTFWKALRSVLVVLGVAGCAADPTGPRVTPQASSGLLSGLLEMNVLSRKTPLDRDVTASETIGSEGGTLVIPEAGFTLVIPKGAVSEKTKFTVTALAGKAVAYEMGPHGLRFERSLVARQDLTVTTYTGGLLNPLKGAYFTDKSLLDQLSLTALVAEVLNGSTNPLTKTFSFPIDHFSGYVVAW